MASLSRITSSENTVTSHNSQSALIENDNQSSAHSSHSSSITRLDSVEPPSLLAPLSGTLSRSLLSTTRQSSPTSRKSGFSGTEASGAVAVRASVSMPPPTTESSFLSSPLAPQYSSETSDRDDSRPSRFGAKDGVMESQIGSEPTTDRDLEKTPSLGGSQLVPDSYPTLALPDSSLGHSTTPITNADPEGNRISYSPTYPLGLATSYGAARTSNAPSVASSYTSSIKTSELSQPIIRSFLISSSIGSEKASKGEALLGATTATDLVSVTTNSHSQYAGMCAMFLNCFIENRRITNKSQPYL